VIDRKNAHIRVLLDLGQGVANTVLLELDGRPVLFDEFGNELDFPIEARLIATVQVNGLPGVGDVDVYDVYIATSAALIVEQDGAGDVFSSIQAAIKSAVSGNTIIVRPGTYFESIDFGGKSLTIQSMDPTDPQMVANTIIDGDTKRTAVRFRNFEDADAILDGFTIRNGNANSGNGGGIEIDQSSPTIRNCTLINNVALVGGAIDIIDGDPRIENCTFQNNTASVGGAIRASGSFVELSDCVFTSNTASDTGGAMACRDSGFPLLVRCVFTNNNATNSGGAIAILSSAVPFVVNCEFISNSSLLGGAVSCENVGSDADFANCIFRANSATDTGGRGGAFYVNEATLILGNCTLVGNTADTSGGAMEIEGSSDTPLILNSILWNNSPGQITGGTPTVIYSLAQGGITGTGNISSDPMFADELGGDLSLTADSPAIDAGDNSGVLQDFGDLDNDQDVDEAVPFDFDGNTRIVDDPATPDTGAGSAPIVDMGAYEFRGVLQRVFVNSNNASGGDGTTWGGAFTDLQAGIDLARNQGGEGTQVFVAQGT